VLVARSGTTSDRNKGAMMGELADKALAAANELRGLIVANRDATERHRQLPDSIVAGLISSKLCRAALPARYDGLELPPADMLPILQTLAEAEASVAWIVWNNSLPCWFARFLAEDVRDEIFASSTRPSGRAVANGESYIVNGRWSLVSGCMHADWIPVMCMVEVDGEVEMLAPKVPHMRMCFVPRTEHEILDTWHVGGLRGTGSHDSVLNDVAVPVPRTFAMGSPSLMDSPLGRVPIFCTMIAGGASICLGIAQASRQALLDLAVDKVPVDGGPGLRDRAQVQALVARTDALLDSLRARLANACDEIWRTIVAGDPVEARQIGSVMSIAITTAQACRAAVTEIYAAAGTSSLYTDNPIERAHRDIHAVTQHIALQPFWLEQSGRVSLGMEPNHPLFWL
jgi:alkylation response protein AidB-like acyl-CoA dehydrogenase